MKKLLLGVTMGALMSTSAYAVVGETVTGTVNVDGERECVCELTGFNGEGSTTFVNFGNMDNLGEADTQQLTELGLFCNLPAEVSFSSTNGYLALNTTNVDYIAADGDNDDFSTSAAPGFAAGLNYEATIDGLGLTGDTGQLDAGVVEIVGVIPPQDQSGVTVSFDTIAGSLPLVAGEYSDTLIVSITPVAL